MIRHEIERHQVQPQEMEIVLYLDPMLYWFNGHLRRASVTRRGPVGLGNALCYHAACSGAGVFVVSRMLNFWRHLYLRRLLPCN